MHAHNRSAWKRWAAGMIGGAAGTTAMALFVKATTKLGAPDMANPPRKREHNMSLVGRQHGEEESPTAALGRILYRKVRGAEPDPRTKTRLSYAVHWAYGTDIGGLYGLLHNGAGPLVGGAALGAAVWLLNDELAVPLLGLSEGPKAFPLSLHAESLGAHVAYGVAVAATTAAMERLL